MLSIANDTINGLNDIYSLFWYMFTVSSEVPVHDYFQIFVFQGKIVTTKLYFLDI